MDDTSDAHFQFNALQRTLFVHADLDGDRVSGLVLGIGWHDRATECFYLVSDPRRPAPVWVSERSLLSQRWFADEGRRPAPRT